MSVRGKVRLVAAVFAVLLVGACEDSKSRMKVSKTSGVAAIPKGSGYTPGTRQWSDFLQCWQTAVRQASSLRDRSYSVLDGGRIGGSPAPDLTVSSAIKAAENALGTTLPTSYKDFLQVYEPTDRVATRSELKSTVGLFAVRDIARLKTFDSEVLKLAKKYPIDAADAQYFVYGVGQDDTNSRTRYRADAIIVGKYGPAFFERIVLYPQVRTSDGEMEAALHHQSGEFRATSFAELMRQLSFLETQDAGEMPPYSQASLRTTCAERLLLTNVWWP